MANKCNPHKPRGGQHSLDAHNAFPCDEGGRPQYYPDGNDESIAHNPDIVNKTRIKMTVQDACDQGIINNPRFTVVLPVRTTRPDRYFIVTDAEKTPHNRKIWVFLDIAGTDYAYSPIRLNPKARLHIIVN